MIIDASVLVAILRDEPESEAFTMAIAGGGLLAGNRSIGALSRFRRTRDIFLSDAQRSFAGHAAWCDLP